MPKYMNVDAIAFLEREVEKHVKHYQTDFNYDKDTFLKNVENKNKEDKTFLWMARSAGTHCVLEHNALIKRTPENNVWTYYREQKSDNIIAYIVELLSLEDGIVKGNLYQVNYNAHSQRVFENAVEPSDMTTFVFESCEKIMPVKALRKIVLEDYEKEFGEYKYRRDIPADSLELARVLNNHKAARNRLSVREVDW